MRIIYILLGMIALTSCRSSYQFTPKGFIVEGDEYFVNVERNISVYVGDNFLNYDEKTKTGLQTLYLSHKDQQIINKLGYHATDYTVLFNGNSKGDTVFKLISLINNKFEERFKNTKALISRDGFSIKKTEEGTYYYRMITLKKQIIYHAIVPFKQELGREEYVSLIYVIPEQDFKNFYKIEDIAISNASMYRQKYVFTPSRTEILCLNDSTRGHLDYRIPVKFVQNENYSLLKGYLNQNGQKQLIVYRLVNPGQSYGSFVVCKGNYEIELTDLHHNTIWKDEILVEDDLPN